MTKRNLLLSFLYGLGLLGASCAYLTLSISNIRLPGIYYDELLQVVPAMSALGYSLKHDIYSVPGTLIHIGRLNFPLLVMPYTGSVEASIFVPIFAIFGVSIETIRFTYIALGFIALILTFIWVRDLVNIRVAIITVLLLGTDASFIFFTRSDHGPIATMMIIKLAMLIFLNKWWKSKKTIYLYLGAFLCGFGIYDKTNFLWLIPTIAIVMLSFGFRGLWQRLHGHWNLLIISGGMLIAGASPFLAYVLLSGGGPFRTFISSFGKTSLGTNNRDALGNLITRLHSWYEITAGYEALNLFTTSFVGVQVPFDHPIISLQPWLMGLAVILPILIYIFGGRRFDNRLSISLGTALGICILIVLSVFTPTSFSANHLLIIYPFPQLLISNSAILLWDLANAAKKLPKRLTQSVVIIAIALTTLSNAATSLQNHRVLMQTHGVGMWSAAIYDLSDYLVSQHRSVICLDWGFYLNLLALSGGQLDISNQWQQFLYAEEETTEMEHLIQENRSALFLFHSQAQSGVLTMTGQNYPRLTFFKAANKLNLNVHRVRAFTEVNGDLLYEVYAVDY